MMIILKIILKIKYPCLRLFTFHYSKINNISALINLYIRIAHIKS